MNLSEAKKILELGQNYTPEEIKANYRRLVKIFHPDKSGSDSCKFIKIQEAYEYMQKEPIQENIIENILKSFNFKIFTFTPVVEIEITGLEYLTGTTKEIKVKSSCNCQRALCRKCLGTGTTIQLGACDSCLGDGGLKICKCENYTLKKVVIPPKPNLLLKIENCKIKLKDYKIINNKLTKIFDITLKESLLGFTKTFEDPFGEIHNIILKTIVKQNDGYTLKMGNHEMILLFNIIYPEKLSKSVKKTLESLNF